MVSVEIELPEDLIPFLQGKMNEYCPLASVSVHAIQFVPYVACVSFPYFRIFVHQDIGEYPSYSVYAKTDSIERLKKDGVRFDRGYPKHYLSALLACSLVVLKDDVNLFVNEMARLSEISVCVLRVLKALIRLELTTKEELKKPAKTPVLLPIIQQCASRVVESGTRYVRNQDRPGQLKPDYFSEYTSRQCRCYFCGVSYLA